MNQFTIKIKGEYNMSNKFSSDSGMQKLFESFRRYTSKQQLNEEDRLRRSGAITSTAVPGSMEDVQQKQKLAMELIKKMDKNRMHIRFRGDAALIQSIENGNDQNVLPGDVAKVEYTEGKEEIAPGQKGQNKAITKFGQKAEAAEGDLIMMYTDAFQYYKALRMLAKASESGWEERDNTSNLTFKGIRATVGLIKDPFGKNRQQFGFKGPDKELLQLVNDLTNHGPMRS